MQSNSTPEPFNDQWAEHCRVITDDLAETAEKYPAPMPTQLVVPGELVLTRVAWKPVGALVEGTVGGVAFVINVETGDLLNRKRFATNLWRFKKLLPVLPTLNAWQEMIRQAEEAAK